MLGAHEASQAALLSRDEPRVDRRGLAHLALLAAAQIVALSCRSLKEGPERHVASEGSLSDTA